MEAFRKLQLPPLNASVTFVPSPDTYDEGVGVYDCRLRDIDIFLLIADDPQYDIHVSFLNIQDCRALITEDALYVSECAIVARQGGGRIMAMYAMGEPMGFAPAGTNDYDFHGHACFPYVGWSAGCPFSG